VRELGRPSALARFIFSLAEEATTGGFLGLPIAFGGVGGMRFWRVPAEVCSRSFLADSGSSPADIPAFCFQVYNFTHSQFSPRSLPNGKKVVEMFASRLRGFFCFKPCSRFSNLTLPI